MQFDIYCRIKHSQLSRFREERINLDYSLLRNFLSFSFFFCGGGGSHKPGVTFGYRHFFGGVYIFNLPELVKKSPAPPWP